MPNCEHCGVEVMLPFECNFCGGHFCTDHRLPESHNCKGEPPRTPLGSWQSKNIPKAKESKRNIMESEGDFHFRKKTPFSYKPIRRKHFPIKKTVAVVSVLAIVAILLWQSPAIISFLQSHSSNSSDASYTSLFIRSGTYTEPIEFGDTEYYFIYITGYLPEISIHAPFKSDLISYPKVGTSYERLGIEVKVANVSSDYISDFIVIKVKPIVDNYMFSTFRYTKVDIPLREMRTVDISSGLIDKTNQYTFEYLFAPSGPSSAELNVITSSQSKRYSTYVGLIIPEAKNDFEIEIRVFKADSNHMVIYVKPLY